MLSAASRFTKNSAPASSRRCWSSTRRFESNAPFVFSYLAKLRPGAETDFERDPKAHAEHLRRCRDFAITLPPALNSLKAHVLFHHLRLQAELGNHPKDDFLTFLALPTNAA